MGLLYDITKDYLYQEGLTKGREEGIERGIEKGIEKGIEQGSERARREMIIEMLRDGALTHHKIAALAKVPVAYVTQVAHELSTDH
jgi:predicted transposase YdaD